jgi:HD superfamily phosphohydrolase
VQVDLSVFEGDYGAYTGEEIEQPFEDERIPSPLSEGRYGVMTLCELMQKQDNRSALALLSRIIVDVYARNHQGRYARSPADDGYDDYLEARELFDKAHDSSVDDREIADLLRNSLRENHTLPIVVGLERVAEDEIEEAKEFLGNIVQACKMPAPSLDFSLKQPKAEKPAKPAKEPKVKREKPAKPVKEPEVEMPKSDKLDAAETERLDALSSAAEGKAPNAATLAFAKMLAEQMTAAAKDL